MNIFVCRINPKSVLIEMVVVVDDRIIMCSWMPARYPDRVRIEKVIRGAALPKDRFLALSEAVPIVLRPEFEGKSLKQWAEMVGSAFSVDATLEAL